MTNFEHWGRSLEEQQKPAKMANSAESNDPTAEPENEDQKSAENARIRNEVKSWLGGVNCGLGESITGVFHDIGEGMRIGRSYDRKQVYVTYAIPVPGVTDSYYISYDAIPDRLAMVDAVIPADAW